ncbi:MAG: helix-turn-helix transcriptional regulator [Bacteroidota bacterium]
MRRHNLLLGLLLLIPVYGNGQQARLSGKISLDTGWARKFYVSRLPGFDQMFTASRALIIAEGDLDSAGNFSVDFSAGKDESLYRLHFIRKGDPASTLIIGSRDVNHVFFIAKYADQIHFYKKQDLPIRQSDIGGSRANSELNTLLKLTADDTTGNNTFISVADRSTSQLAGLLAISHTAGLTDEQNEKVRRVLSRYDQHYAYGANIFREYSNSNEWKLYLTGGILLFFALLLYGYRFYRQRSILKTWRELSQREMDIVGLILSGKSNKEVALALNIELSTVKTHVNNIYAKLGVNNRKDLDRYKNFIIQLRTKQTL